MRSYSEKYLKQKGLWLGSSGRVPAWKMQVPEFKPYYYQKGVGERWRHTNNEMCLKKRLKNGNRSGRDEYDQSALYACLEISE
jgi:hypothetical protein